MTHKQVADRGTDRRGGGGRADFFQEFMLATDGKGSLLVAPEETCSPGKF